MRVEELRYRYSVRTVLATIVVAAAVGATTVLAWDPPGASRPPRPPKKSQVAPAFGVSALRVAARRRPAPAGAVGQVALQVPAGTNALILADRRTIQRLSLAKKLLAQKDYTQAVGMLQKVIERDKDAFYYPDPTKRESIQSVRIAAQRMIGAMPKAGQDVYQLKFGGTAKVLLADAATAGNTGQIAEIARRYFHTNAGYSAMYRLGVLHLDQGRPLAAALCFEKLRRLPDEARKWEPVLSLRTAVCWNRAGMPEKVKQALETVQRAAAGRQVVIGGRPIKLFLNAADGPQWLAKNFGNSTVAGSAAETDWTVFRGNRARNAVVTLPEKPRNIAWHKSIIPDPTSDPYGDRSDQAETAIRKQLEQMVSSLKGQFQQARAIQLPSTHPVVVGGVLITRSMSALRAIELDTGKWMWEGFPDAVLEKLLTTDGTRPIPAASNHIRQLAAQRVWNDQTWGGLSTSGEHVYSIEDLGLQYPVRLPGDTPRTFETVTRDRRVNRLVARNVRALDIRWTIGGSATQDSRPEPFAGTFFLGSPLPLGGHLYCLAEVDGEVRLLAFELSTSSEKTPPTLVWSQPLVGANMRIDNDRQRRVAGTMLSYADGIIVCPTDAGYVIAVDVTSRSLLWGYRYEQPGRRPGFFPGRPRPVPQPGRASRWLDSTCTIDNGKVLITPRGTDDVVCLNLVDGAVIWKKKRADGLYVAGIRDGRAIIVGAGSVRALKMSDGTAAWIRSTTIATPSGRGIATADRLLVPLSTGAIADVDLKTGRLLAKVKTPGGRVPGNLLLANGVLISQGTDTIEALPLPPKPR